MEATAIQNLTCRSEREALRKGKEKADVAEVKGGSNGEK